MLEVNNQNVSVSNGEKRKFKQSNLDCFVMMRSEPMEIKINETKQTKNQEVPINPISKPDIHLIYDDSNPKSKRARRELETSDDCYYVSLSGISHTYNYCCGEEVEPCDKIDNWERELKNSIRNDKSKKEKSTLVIYYLTNKSRQAKLRWLRSVLNGVYIRRWRPKKVYIVDEVGSKAFDLAYEEFKEKIVSEV